MSSSAASSTRSRVFWLLAWRGGFTQWRAVAAGGMLAGAGIDQNQNSSSNHVQVNLETRLTSRSPPTASPGARGELWRERHVGNTVARTPPYRLECGYTDRYFLRCS